MGKKREEFEEKILDVDASMQGTISFKDPVNLRINGSFEGRLETRGTLTIGENAKVKANINGDRIIIAGRVTGDVVALQSLNVVAPAVIRGNIQAPIFAVSEGATIDGQLTMSSLAKETDNDVFNLKEVAQYLEVEAHVVEEWAQKKRIPAYQENDGWKFRRNDIDVWIQRERVGS